MKRFITNVMTVITIFFVGSTSAWSQTDTYQMLHAPAPLYPPIALTKQQQGFIEVAIHFNQQGEVFDIDIIKAENRILFERAVLLAVSNWKIRPENEENLTIYKTFEFKLMQSDNSANPLATNTIAAQPYNYRDWQKRHRQWKNSFHRYLTRKHGQAL